MARLLRSVLVPTDFSTGAEIAVERALQLPLAPSAKLTVLHVLPEGIPGKLRREALTESEQRLATQLERLRALTAERDLAKLQLVTDVVEGNAAHHIMKRANTVEADVICIGRHGRRGVIDSIVGQTVTRVLRQTDHPVLLAQLQPSGPYRRPLFALDPSHAALSVARAGAAVLPPDTKRVSVFTATPVPYEDFVSIGTQDRIALRKRFERDGEKALKALLKKLPELEFHATVRSGDARTLLIEETAASATDLLVLGTHGRKTLGRILIGSVAEWVLTHAKCDVLVVRP